MQETRLGDRDSSAGSSGDGEGLLGVGGAIEGGEVARPGQHLEGDLTAAGVDRGLRHEPVFPACATTAVPSGLPFLVTVTVTATVAKVTGACPGRHEVRAVSRPACALGLLTGSAAG